MGKVAEDEDEENDPKCPMFENSCNEGPGGNAVEEDYHHRRNHPEILFHA